MTERDDSSGLRGARPEGGIEREQRRNQLASRMFGVEQELLRLGRFVLLQHLGSGGMGSVHAAYDPQLDRRVALKLLRSGAQRNTPAARGRLLREAQALARLSHPNVVPVYDAGVIDGQVFLVMEYVVGQTLRDWLNEETRDWREVLKVYLQAGTGLSAAHEMGIVHRDFKPDNVIRGSDGRVRVLDFGLARGYGKDTEPDSVRAEGEPDSVRGESEPDDRSRAESEPDDRSRAESEPDDRSRAESEPDSMSSSPRSSSERLSDAEPSSAPDTEEDDADEGAPSDPGLAFAVTNLAGGETLRDSDGSGPGPLGSPLTATGTIVGTPAYMAPEQFIGADVGPEGDQFSFCASLYEGLYGSRPFGGDDIEALKANVLANRRRAVATGSGVPRWVASVLERGLQREPGDRYESMAALLAELGRDRVRTRNRRAIGLAFVGLAGTMVWTLTRAPADAADLCAGAEAQLASVWNPERRDGVERALRGTGRAFANEVWPRVAAGLDRYRADWVAMHTGACVAHRRGEQSGELLDRRMACLDRRRSALDGAVAVLAEIEANNLAKAVEVVDRLPAIEYCANVAALTADVAPPEDPGLAAKVRGLRDRLSRAEALEHAGRLPEALEAAEAVLAEPDTETYRPVLAEALLVKGRVLLFMERSKDAIDPLTQAFLLGVETDMERAALEALARFIYAQGINSGSPELALSYVGLGEALSRKVPGSAFGHALLLNNAGAVLLAGGDRDGATKLFERALIAKERPGRGDALELTAISSNLLLANRHSPEARAAVEPIIARLERALGSAHPRTLQMRLIYSRSFDSPAQALAVRESVCDAYQQHHPELVYTLVRCHYSVGFLHAELGDVDAAAKVLSRLGATVEHSQKLVASMSRTARGFVHLYERRYRAARDILEGVAEGLRPEASKWWFEVIRAHALVGQGLAQLELGASNEAIASLREALAALEKIAPLVRLSEMQRRLAEARWALARALVASAETGTGRRERVQELVSGAEDWYRRAGEGYEWRLSELERWRRAHAVESLSRAE